MNINYADLVTFFSAKDQPGALSMLGKCSTDTYLGDPSIHLLFSIVSTSIIYSSIV